MTYSYTRPTADNYPEGTFFWGINVPYDTPYGTSILTGLFCATRQELEGIVGMKLLFPAGTDNWGTHPEVRGIFEMAMCRTYTDRADYIRMHLENGYTVNSPLEHVVEEWPT